MWLRMRTTGKGQGSLGIGSDPRPETRRSLQQDSPIGLGGYSLYFGGTPIVLGVIPAVPRGYSHCPWEYSLCFGGYFHCPRSYSCCSRALFPLSLVGGDYFHCPRSVFPLSLGIIPTVLGFIPTVPRGYSCYSQRVIPAVLRGYSPCPRLVFPLSLGAHSHSPSGTPAIPKGLFPLSLGVIPTVPKLYSHSPSGILGPHVVLGGAADVAALALDALPAIGLHGCHHHRRELEAGWVSYGNATRHQEQPIPGLSLAPARIRAASSPT